MRSIIRIHNTDLDGNKAIYMALKKIKGISFMFSNAICNHLKISKSKKSGELTPEEIKRIEKLVEDPKELPDWMLNRRKDIETGENIHITTAKLRLTLESDLKKLKKIKSYRGMRHAWNLPVRGQRTKAHFRRGKKVGVVKKKIVQAKKKSDKPAGK
ncbi:MAG: 30S ribosomal protein S13 [Nanoarchaeota archaeon]|nr:30S ribosomal protein S13 [Nanoarchaeota archaeon]